MAPLKANLSIREKQWTSSQINWSSSISSLLNGVNLHKCKTHGLILERKVFRCTQQWDSFYFESINSQMLVDSRRKIKRVFPGSKLKPEPCSLYHRIESTVDQQHLVSVKHSGLSLRQSEVNALRQSCTILHPQGLPFLLGRAWITAGELKAGTCFYLSDTPALCEGWCWEGVEKVVENSTAYKHCQKQWRL